MNSSFSQKLGTSGGHFGKVERVPAVAANMTRCEFKSLSQAERPAHAKVWRHELPKSQLTVFSSLDFAQWINIS